MCQKPFEGNDLFQSHRQPEIPRAGDISQILFFQSGKLVESHLSIAADKT